MTLSYAQHPAQRAALDRVYVALERGGHRPVLRGSHIQARCPVHEDRTPSLGIDWSPERGGMVLLRCYACADAVDGLEIAAAIGLAPADLFDAPLPREQRTVPRRRPAKPRTARKPVNRLGPLPSRITLLDPADGAGPWRTSRTYDYHDAEGTVVGQVVREERPTGGGGVEKRFRQRRPDGRDGWEWKRPDQVVLYRLPQLLEATGAGEQIWVAEGEKDADALVAAGAAATTNPQGAGNFGDDLVGYLTGARVVVVVDRDGAGYRRAVDLETRLRPVVADLRFVLPAVTGDHQDAADHLAAGHGLGAFVPMTVLAAAVWAAANDARAAAGRVDVAAAEVAERGARAAAAGKRGAKATAKDEARYARRWAHEAVRAVERATTAVGEAWAAAELLGEARTAGQTVPDAGWGQEGLAVAEDAMRRGQRVARQAWQSAGEPMPAQVQRVLDRVTASQAAEAAARPAAAPAGPGPAGPGSGGDRGGDGAGGQVLPFPGGGEEPGGRGGGGGSSLIPASMIKRPKFERVATDGGGEIVEIRKARYGEGVDLVGVLGLDARIVALETFENDDADERAAEAAGGLAPRGSVVRAEQVLAHYLVVYTDPQTGESLHLRVEADRMRKGDWLADLPVADLRYDSSPRGRARVWDAVRATSGPAPVTTIYRSTGWRRIEPHGWVYVHAGGGISASGTVPLEVQLPGPLARVDLPEPGTDPAVIRAAFDRHSGRAFLERLPEHVGAVLAGTAYRAVLGRNEHATVVYGVPGTYKSAVAALTMHHFGEGWDRDRASTSMSGQGATLHALREELWDARDCLFFGDDFAPDRSVAAASSFLANVARMQHNREIRDRFDPHAGTVRRGHHSRTSLLLTSEVRASTESGTQRLAMLDLAKGDVELDQVRTLDAVESRRGRAGFTAALLRWLASDVVGARRRAEDRAEAAAARRRAIGHEDRVAAAMGELEAGWALVTDFLVAVGAYQLAEAEQLLAGVQVALDEAAARAVDPDSPTSVGERVRQLLVAALRSGYIHLTESRGREPAYPAALRYGWRRVETRGAFADSENGTYRLEARGEWAGAIARTVHGQRLHLDPTKAMQAITETARKSGETLAVTRSVVQRELATIGVLRVEPGAPTRYTCVVPDPAGTGGKTRMWDLDERALFDDDAPHDGSSADPTVDEPSGPGWDDQTNDPDAGPDLDDVGARSQAGPGDAAAGGEEGEAAMGAPQRTPVTTILEGSQPCEVCGNRCGVTVDGRVVHWLCADGVPAGVSYPALAPPADPVPGTAAEEATAGEPQDRPEPVSATQVQEPRQGAATAPGGTQEGVSGSRRARRWLAVAAVVDVDAVHLPDGSTRPLPEPFAHAGHAAALVHDLELGCGGDAARRNDPGQVWLTPGMCAQLGLPEILDPDRDKRATQLQEASTGCGWISGATAAGWQVGRGQLAGWLRVWQQGTRSAFVVLMPAIDPTLALLAGDPEPGVLARRLQLYADAAGTAYHVSAQATGLDLLEATRAGRGVKIGTAEQLRAVVDPVEPATHPTVEDELRWSRAPAGDEPGRLYVHAWDRGGSYLAAAAGVALGVGDPVHHNAPTPFDKRLAGYWLVDVPDAADWRLPHPLDPAGRGNPGRRRWFTTPTLALAAELGYALDPVEAYLWPTSGRLLEAWYKRLRDARAGLEERVAAGDPDASAAREMIKATYARTIGEFAARHRAGQPWHRPDWRHMIIATARSNVLRKVVTIGEASGSWPVAMIADSVVYLSRTACPLCAWPGDPAELGHGLGKYSPYGSARLEQHREHLTGRDYRGAPDLTAPDAWEAEHGCGQHRAQTTGESS